MSQENVEIVRQANGYLNDRDWDALLALHHPQLEFCDLRSAVDAPETLRGRKAVEALVAGWSEAWDDFGAEVYNYIDAEPYVICDTRWYGIGRESSIPVDIRQVDVYELRDGRIIRVMLGHGTQAEARKAVGLEE
jgi:ketosteroid isomerase-like protein